MFPSFTKSTLYVTMSLGLFKATSMLSIVVLSTILGTEISLALPKVFATDKLSKYISHFIELSLAVPLIFKTILMVANATVDNNTITTKIPNTAIFFLRFFSIFYTSKTLLLLIQLYQI